jgi:cytochrome c-type biogenesis protein CcmE
MTGRPRLVIALVVSMMLVAFGGYTLLAGSNQLLVSVAQLRSNTDGAAHERVQLTGTVVSANGDGSPLRFVLRDDGAGSTTVPVDYQGSVPEAFEVGRHVIVTGRLDDGTFVAERDSLLTKCPSKYSAGGSGA